MFECSNCGTALAAHARFCSNCGQAQLQGLKYAAENKIDWDANVPSQAHKRFKKRMQERIAEEQDIKRLRAYQERIYESEYRELIQRRFEQWTRMQDRPSSEKQANRLSSALDDLIDDLLDYFFIVHCQDINIVVLPQAILRYQNEDLSSLDLRKMAFDFLHFEQEDERIYTDFLRVPVRKLKNAAKSFLFPEKDEIIWFICDQSLLGNAKEGFAMTEKALYWKTGFQPPQRVYYHMLKKIGREKEWILINELFFNATPSLNTKMLYLLRKLRRLL